MAKRKKTKRAPDGPSAAVAAGRQPDTPAHPPKPRGRLTRQDVLAVLALGLLVAVSYVPAMQGGFVWDDEAFTDARPIRELAGLWRIWFAPADLVGEGHYWPIVYTSFWLEHKLWGFAPTGYHLVNVALHLVNTLLVWQFLRRLAVPGAWLAAAVFAVHPVHVESVAWIIERKDLLSTLFYLAAVLVWVGWAPHAAAGLRAGRYALALALYVAGLLSKSIVVTLPVTLLIYHGWHEGRVTVRDVRRLVPFFAVGLGITIADVAFYASREVISFGYSIVERALIAARALWFYAGKLLLPVDLAVIYPRWDVDAADPLAWGYVIAAGALAALLWFSRHRIGRGPLAGVLFFAVTLAPVLGFIDYGYMQFSLVADRYQYLASLGVITVLSAAAVHAAGRLPGVHWKQGLAAVVLLLLAMLSWRQAGIYRDEVTFFSHVVARNPQARSAYHNLGNALLEAGRLEEAVAACRIAVERGTDTVAAHSNAAVALMRLQRFDEAEDHLRQGLAIAPRHSYSLQNMGELLRKQARYAEALEWYAQLLETDPGHVLAHVGSADALVGLKRYDEAIARAEHGLALRPGPSAVRAFHIIQGRALQESGRPDAAAPFYARVLNTHPHDTGVLDRLAALHFGQQRYREALDLYQTLVELEPGSAATHANIGDVFRKMGDTDAAAEAYARVLDLQPGNTEALDRLAGMRFEQQRYEEALGLYQTLVELEPGSAAAHSNIGAVLFRMGQGEEALRSFDRALALDPAHPLARANREQVQKSLQQGKP